LEIANLRSVESTSRVRAFLPVFFAKGWAKRVFNSRSYMLDSRSYKRPSRSYKPCSRSYKWSSRSYKKVLQIRLEVLQKSSSPITPVFSTHLFKGVGLGRNFLEFLPETRKCSGVAAIFRKLAHFLECRPAAYRLNPVRLRACAADGGSKKGLSGRPYRGPARSE